jgi:U6 snRNA-associated Sm-like protein LSm7
MVLDDVVEQGRSLGLVVFRGTALQFIAPEDGFEEIENPFRTGE